MLIKMKFSKILLTMRYLILLLGLNLVTFSNAAEDTYVFPEQRSQWQAIDWLMLMQQAAREENYEGRFVFSRGPMSSAMSIVHQYENGREREKLKQLDGEMGEIIRDGQQVMCVFPDNRVVEVESNPLSSNFTQKFIGFMPGKSQYSIEVEGKERMIERPCMVLSIKANDQDRYSYKLWIDQKKGLLLKSELLDEQGKTLERFQYTQIAFPEHIDSSLFKAVDHETAVKHELIKTEDDGLAWSESLMWQVDWLPKGYKRINGKAREGENIIVYSDGLSAFSVFIESMNKGKMPEGSTQVGATTAYSVDLVTKGQGYHVTVVGEVPAKTAMKVAKSVKPMM